MGKGSIGAITAVVVWFGATAAAEAQGIDVTISGPQRVESDDSHMTVTATVSGYSSYSFYVKVKINGVQKYNSMTQLGSGSTLNWTVPGVTSSMQNWPIATGNSMEITVKVWVGVVNDTDVETLTVEAAPQTYVPAETRRLPLLLAREESLAWLDRKACGVNA